MLSHEDLDAAVAAGIVTDAQRAALRDLAAQREGARLAAEGHEEHFRFMRGFNDFFLATGVVMLCAGMMFFADDGLVANLIAALVMWGLAELLVKRMQLVLPGILLACFFVAAVYRVIPIHLFDSSAVARMQRPVDIMDLLFTFAYAPPSVVPGAMILRALAAAAGAALFYARFRLPFALLLIAASLIVAIAAVNSLAVGPLARPLQPLVLFICGLGVFAAAIAFDLSDRLRATRRSDCAFWLHLLAAPLIVHSLISTVAPGVNSFTMTTPVALMIIAMVPVLALVALAIDRRALMVSTLSYLGIVIVHAIRTSGASRAAGLGGEIYLTLVILGAFVLVLGVGWLPLRRQLMALLPGPLFNRLPPALA
jgi:hypothetical protein